MSGQLYPSFADEHLEPIGHLQALDFRQLEILSFDELGAERGFEADIFALLDNVAPRDSVRLKITYLRGCCDVERAGGCILV